MRLSSAARAVLTALALFAGSSGAKADDGQVTLVIFKAGWFVGGSAGQGVLTFHDQTYALTAGGIDGGLVFGGSRLLRLDHLQHLSLAQLATCDPASRTDL